jgi:hypothetical protein
VCFVYIAGRLKMATTTEAEISNTTTNNTEGATPKIIKIQSNDGQMFEIDQGVVEQSSTIKTLSDRKITELKFFIILMKFI